MRIISLAFLLVTAAGCAPIHKNGTARYVIIGFGVVSVCTPNQTAQVIKTQAIGLSLNGQPENKLSLGYARGTTIVVPATASAVIEVSDRPSAPLTITTP